MRTNLGMRLSAVAMLAACGYSPNNNGQPDGPRPDGEIPDAGPCQAQGTKECAGDLLRTCNVVGELPAEETCGWGCDSDGEAHCLAIAPAGGVITKDDTKRPLFAALDSITPGTTIDTDEGLIDNVATGFTFTMSGNNGVFRVKELHVTGPLKVVGLRTLIIIADGPIEIGGVVDLHGCEGQGGLSKQGPGGSIGGGAAGAVSAGGGPGGGGIAANKNGGGGGGHGGVGGKGGNTPGGPAGVVYNPDLTMMLQGGSGGGGARGSGGGVGGGGGGAIQLVSNTSITITDSGVIDGGGCGGGGGGGGGNDGGGGGGSGGAILLEAPTITINGELAVNGGAGGASNKAAANGDGQPGGRGRMAAIGGLTDATTQDGKNGGNGGFGGSLDGVAGDVGTVGDMVGSGGGGAIGRIRFNTRSGDVTIADPEKLSPNLSDTAVCSKGEASIVQP